MKPVSAAVAIAGRVTVVGCLALCALAVPYAGTFSGLGSVTWTSRTGSRVDLSALPRLSVSAGPGQIVFGTFATLHHVTNPKRNWATCTVFSPDSCWVQVIAWQAHAKHAFTGTVRIAILHANVPYYPEQGAYTMVGCTKARPASGAVNGCWSVNSTLAGLSRFANIYSGQYTLVYSAIRCASHEAVGDFSFLLSHALADGWFAFSPLNPLPAEPGQVVFGDTATLNGVTNSSISFDQVTKHEPMGWEAQAAHHFSGATNLAVFTANETTGSGHLLRMLVHCQRVVAAVRGRWAVNLTYSRRRRMKLTIPGNLQVWYSTGRCAPSGSSGRLVRSLLDHRIAMGQFHVG
jgi:hypothetical protein